MAEPPLSQPGKLAGTMVSLQVGTQGRQLAGVGEARNALLSGHGGWITAYFALGGAGTKGSPCPLCPQEARQLQVGRKC